MTMDLAEFAGELLRDAIDAGADPRSARRAIDGAAVEIAGWHASGDPPARYAIAFWAAVHDWGAARTSRFGIPRRATPATPPALATAVPRQGRLF